MSFKIKRSICLANQILDKGFWQSKSYIGKGAIKGSIQGVTDVTAGLQNNPEKFCFRNISNMQYATCVQYAFLLTM